MKIIIKILFKKNGEKTNNNITTNQTKTNNDLLGTPPKLTRKTRNQNPNYHIAEE